MPVGTQINITLPTVGMAAWGGPLNAVLQAIVDAVEEQVPPSSIDMTDSLDFQGQFAVNLKGTKYAQTADPGTANTFFVGTDGEYYLRDGNNTLIRLTSTGSINVSVVGGFGGDYSGNGLASYSSSNVRYTFTNAAGSTYAVMESGELRVHNGTSTGYVALRPPSGQSSNVTLTLPPALPTNGGPTLVWCDATGGLNLQASASFTECVDVARGASAFGSQATYSPETLGGGPLGGSITRGWLSTSGAVDLGIDYQVGDRIDSVSFGVNAEGGPITGTLIHRSDDRSQSIIARAAFNSVDSEAKTLQNGTATMTGTLPFTPPGTGSLYLRVASNEPFQFYTCKVARTRRLI
jgi:hypothetical protein